MPDFQWSSIVKWILLILAAGFIGQFGKTFAVHVTQTIRARWGKKEAASVQTPPPAPPDSRIRDEQKLEKKALKAREKERKKEHGNH